ncbi:hypothetical protein [Paraburkholderia metrosideri]|jgi:hypothetical protein|uniref:Peptide-binding protein n=1 Tax=Paraburkholderia metrosideri TaxID=580937 RepID=A0ABN7IDC3_9BURK|nr:hypothetical protein [Paraburkholderia metrosideri]CAD6557139.1 hypothetical protein LMG28140_06081 [Paraburkholderia metrosideri]
MRVTKVDGLSRTKHWALGAVITVLCSFVYAKGPGVPHGGGGFSGAHSGGYSHAQERSVRANMIGGGRYSGARAVAARPNPYQAADRNARLSRGAPNYAGGGYANGFGGGNGFGVYSPSVRGLTAAPSRYSDDGRGRMQYAGAITQVSAESRSVPRPPANAPMRTGSIRADVARYNEERGASRGMQRQNDDPRQPEGSPYRN